jgi:hypothetical protein
VAQQKPQNNSGQQQQGNLGGVRNERNSTMPQVAASTNTQTENELVGCVNGSGNKLTLTQNELRRTYELRGNTGQLQSNVGKLVKVTGKLVLGQQSAFEVNQVTPLHDKCQYEQTGQVSPATGKTGPQHEAMNVTSTQNPRQTTPGVQTERGVEQNPSNPTRPQKYGANAGGSAPLTASQGAPANPNANPDNPESAQRIANAAQQSELSNSQATLGVNAQPNYSNSQNPQANAQATANTAQQERGQAAAGDAANPKGGAQQSGQNAQQASSTGSAPVFTGCLTQSGNSYVLTEKSSNEKFKIAGDTSKLKDHVNHMVQIVGNKTGTFGPAVGTSGDYQTLTVQAIQDAAPTCQQ